MSSAHMHVEQATHKAERWVLLDAAARSCHNGMWPPNVVDAMLPISGICGGGTWVTGFQCHYAQGTDDATVCASGVCQMGMECCLLAGCAITRVVGCRGVKIE